MPTISSYALQYSNVNFTSLLSSTFDLFITEGAPLAPGGGFPAISDVQVAQLLAQGRHVVGYVNVCVTDDARYYWNPSWTSNGTDTGTPVAGQAPSWLDQAIPLNFDGIPGQDALLVEYWDPAWQQIVVDQAVALVQRGYSGVFLDDVGQYFTAGSGSGTVALMADRMIDLVHAVKLAITAVDPDAFVVTNTNPYIVTDNSGGGSGTRSQTFRADVELHLIENQAAAVLDYFLAQFPGEPLLILQSLVSPPLTYDQAWSRGILFTAPPGYDGPGTFAYPATAGADALAGGDGPNQIDGLGGDDLLYGRGGNDTLTGGEGADLLDGGAGTDTLTGGNGNDSYVVDALDTIVETQTGGNDTVYVGASYVLTANWVEYLATSSQAGTAAINLTGNGFANILFGNNGANILTGGAGQDMSIGYGGNDSYVIDQVTDQIVEASGGGSDTVFAGFSYALTFDQEVEYMSTISQAGTAAINFTGNNLSNTIFGNNGANVLNGLSGVDSLVGFGGNDTYYVDHAGDQVYETAGNGSDTIYTSASYALQAGQHVEALSTTAQVGTGAINLIGNELNNTIFGNNGANTLNGGGGNDYLDAFGGADTFAFTTALGAGNVDTIAGYSVADDTIALDDAVFAGIGPLGTLGAGAFHTGAAAADSSDRVIYNNTTGQLYFDADGSGAGAQVLFATIGTGLALTASDFTVI